MNNKQFNENMDALTIKVSKCKIKEQGALKNYDAYNGSDSKEELRLYAIWTRAETKRLDAEKERDVFLEKYSAAML